MKTQTRKKRSSGPVAKPAFTIKHNPQTGDSKHSGDLPPQAQEKSWDVDSDRNSGIATRKLASINSDEDNFNFVVDGVPYFFKSIPFIFNNELRFRVILNGETEHLFVWDSKTGMICAIHDESPVLPLGVEEVISVHLQSS